MGIVEQYLLQLNTQKQRFRRSVAFLTVLSLLVILTVSWNLRQTGVAFANNANCGLEEHQHSEVCPMEKVLICGWETEESEMTPTQAETEVPTEAPTEALTEDPTEVLTEEPTEGPAEVPVEAISEEDTQTPTEPPLEETAEAPVEESAGDPEKTSAEDALEIVMDAAADLFSAFIPVAQASEIPDEENGSTHIHTDECYRITWLCGLEEHIHEFSCYCDVTADLEDWNIWTSSIPELTGRISEDIVLVAQSQLGFKESELNFELSEDGQTRNGITRYGQWYGNPYGSWSNMFTSFCLRFAGLDKVPINSGAEKMQLEWDKLNLYRHAGGYEPVSGDIVFLDKNQNGTPESTAVVIKYFDFVLTVIEGDVDNTVVQTEYMIDDPVITGYGMTNSANRVIMFSAGEASTSKAVGVVKTYSSNLLTNGTNFILYTIGNDGKYYAMDGNGGVVEVTVENGFVLSSLENTDTLYWTVSSNNGIALRNVATSRYLYPTTNGTLLSNSRSNLTFSTSSTGAKIQGYGYNYGNYGSAYYYVQLAASNQGFTSVSGQNNGSTLYFAQAPSQATLWLDGTNGGIMSYSGSVNRTYASLQNNTPTYVGNQLVLPDTWPSPSTYQYKLAGWADIETGEYYPAGSTIVLMKDTILYADWVAATYDIGQYNSHVVDTLSTNDFITTELFDYSSLINMLSTKATISSLTANTHAETWAHIASTSNPNTAASGDTTLDFSFVDDDWGDGNYNEGIDDPSDRTDNSNWTGEKGIIRTGILGNRGTNVRTHKLITTLFEKDPTKAALGVHYLGTGDHLFQFETNPNDKYYGYYYYDSTLNAASYNQTDQRFYVYDYLEVSSDSPGNSSYSDFLPLNSPYANTANVTNPVTSGVYGSSAGDSANMSYYEYEARSQAGQRVDNKLHSSTRVNWWFGMRTDISFGLPDDPGTGGNKDIGGKNMHFHFTGDDDVWILIDGKLVLDLGGIHLAVDGDINFSTGVITATNGDGTVSYTANLTNYGIGAGEHTLTILYLERGGSMGNCSIYFNLAPRFSLTLQKEDVLTQELLNGAKFGIYSDQSCKDQYAVMLWPSKALYYEDVKNNCMDHATNEFSIVNGKAYLWGLSPSKTYYIKEVESPKVEGYPTEPALGVIKVTLDLHGLNNYGATILPDDTGNISHGYTVHGFKINEEEQAVYLSITNAQNWVKTTTKIYVKKVWNDNLNHASDSVTVYLQVTDPEDGTVRRIRQIDLCAENGWEYTWTNLPMYQQDEETGHEIQSEETKVKYSVAEAYKSGYSQEIKGGEVVTGGPNTAHVTWAEAKQFSNGFDYILKVADGYLSVVSEDSDALQIVDEATAKSSELALWKATVSSNLVQLKNEATGLMLSFNNGNTKYFNVVSSGGITSLKPETEKQGIVLSHTVGTGKNATKYCLASLNEDGYGTTVSEKKNGLVIYPMEKQLPDFNGYQGYWYTVTNTPLTTETSVRVNKTWSHPTNNSSAYEKLKVTVKLYSNGVDTGRTETLDLKSNWTAVFRGLPYQDAQGNKYVYTIVESSNNIDWIPVCGEAVESGGQYTIQLQNVYRWTDSVELPSTGGIGYPLLILIGLILISAPFVYGFSTRRKHERRLPE